jgi:hypothetical protein
MSQNHRRAAPTINPTKNCHCLRCTGVQRRSNPAVAPAFAEFRYVRSQIVANDPSSDISKLGTLFVDLRYEKLGT